MEEMKAGLVLDKMVQQTNIWIKDLMYELNLTDEDRAYQVLRATLKALRDRLTPEQAVHLASQLPNILRGTFFDGWKIAGKPLKLRTQEEFFNHMEKLHNAPLPVDAESAARAVFKLLRHHIAEGEIEKIESIMPEQLLELWPQKVT